jgi:uncharacterized protein YfdQ (DUF2303 family)
MKTQQAATPALPAADSIKELIHLAGKAAGLTLDTISGPGGRLGVPSEIPVGIRHGNQPELVDVRYLFEAYRTAPERIKGVATVTTLQSFVDLVTRHCSDAASVIFAETAWPKPCLTAVIDYHDVSHTPAFAQHRIQYPFPLTEEFIAWMEKNEKLMEQRLFAEFLEEHAAELASPTAQEVTDYEYLFKEKFANPGELIQLSRELEIHTSSTVKRAERLQSGERTIHFTEQHSTPGQGNTGHVSIPGIFIVSVPAFIDGAPVRIPTRLRYRVSGGTISWSYSLYRAAHWLRNHVVEDMDRAAKATKLPAYEGTPEK